MNGIEVLQQIRSDPRTRLVPVVMLTSSTEEPDIAGAYREGVNSYIFKPVDYLEFNEVVKYLGFYWLVLNRQPTSVVGSSPEAIPELVGAGS
jgi:two-component system, response regulator